MFGTCFLVVLAFHGIWGLNFYLESAEFETMDPEYVDPDKCTMDIVSINDTMNGITTNLTIIKALPLDTHARCSLFQQSMGDYTVSGGLDLVIPICEMINEPMIFAKLLPVMGFDGTICPPTPGNYGTDLWIPDTNLMPPSMPGSNYMLSFSLTTGEKNIVRAAAYGTVF